MHEYTKVFLTYFGPLNANFYGDKPENGQKNSYRQFSGKFEKFSFFAQNKKYVRILHVII